MRTASGIIGGIIVAFLFVFPAELLSHFFYPPVARLMGAMPMAAKVLVLAAWIVGGIAGALVAIRIARRSVAGWIVALLVIVAGTTIKVFLPHSTWT